MGVAESNINLISSSSFFLQLPQFTISNQYLQNLIKSLKYIQLCSYKIDFTPQSFFQFKSKYELTE